MIKIFFTLSFCINIFFLFLYPAKDTNEDKQAPLFRGPFFSEKEEAFVKERRKKVLEQLKTVFPEECSTIQEPENAPVIAVVGSGGGYRAMISTTGFLRGLEAIKILDTTTYCAGLSGSTWCIAPWIIKDKPLTEFSHQLRENVRECFELKLLDPKPVISYLLTIKKKDLRKPTLCDGWGTALASIFFKEDGPTAEKNPPGTNYTLLSVAEKINPEKYPLPLFTAIFSKSHPYEWMEFTPFSIGSSYINTHLKAQNLGYHFLNGEIILRPAQTSLSYLLGLFGSAYAFEYNKVLDFIIDKIESNLSEKAKKQFSSIFEYIKKPLTTLAATSKPVIKTSQNITTALYEKVWGKNNSLPSERPEAHLGEIPVNVEEKYRMSPPILPNFTRGLSPEFFKDDYFYTLVDAGLDFNIPFPPLLERKIDLYIVFDASSNTALLDTKNNAMVGAADYAKRKNYPFPSIEKLKDADSNPIEKRVIVLNDDNHNCPTIIYIPNLVEITTLKFSYSGQEFDDLENGAYKTVIEAEEIIKKTIRDVIKKVQDQSFNQPSIEQKIIEQKNRRCIP